jgi:hypothetical protein
MQWEIFILDLHLVFCPTVPSEKALMARFAKIGVGAGKTFDASKLSPETKAAIEQGMVDAWVAFAGLKKEFEAGKLNSGDVFGTRQYLKNDYLYRMGAAVLGIYGNSKQEALYPWYYVDATKQKLDGTNRYTLRFAPGQLPPVNAFFAGNSHLFFIGIKGVDARGGYFIGPGSGIEQQMQNGVVAKTLFAVFVVPLNSIPLVRTRFLQFRRLWHRCLRDLRQ